jgi:hypothetical protein
MLRDATVNEYGNATSTSHAVKKIMPTKRTTFVEWRFKEKVIATKMEVIKRGKVISTTYQVDADFLS